MQTQGSISSRWPTLRHQRRPSRPWRVNPHPGTIGFRGLRPLIQKGIPWLRLTVCWQAKTHETNSGSKSSWHGRNNRVKTGSEMSLEVWKMCI